jgi:osmotically-inducible protein OsmY
VLVRGACVVLTLLLTAACARVGKVPLVDPATIADATITAAIKTALLNSARIDGTTVTVRTEGGVVQLGGTQPTAEAAAEVVSIARGAPGVRDVQSSVAISDTAGPGTTPSR